MITSTLSIACNNTFTVSEPTSWDNYRPEFITKKDVKPGNYVGLTSMLWEAKTKGTFTSQPMIKLITQDTSIVLYDSIFVAKKDLSFAPKYRTYDYKMEEDKNYPYGFERWIDEDMMIYRFVPKRLDPNTVPKIVFRYYIVINTDGTKQSLLYLSN
ncbi:MAG: hypothetical protein EOO91_10255 [Pedobacter sp.]|nr:MAG: hypothetical protein EOO91_10255 [Pedobacter sp.]